MIGILNRIERLENAIKNQSGGMCTVIYKDGNKKRVSVVEAFKKIGVDADIVDVIPDNSNIKGFDLIKDAGGGFCSTVIE